MTIRKSDDIENESGSQYSKSKSTTKLENITERFDDTTDNDNPFDDALQYVNKKIDECIDVINTNDTKVTFPGIGTTSSTCKAGDTTTISTTQATLLTNLGSGITSQLRGVLTISKDEENNLVITDGSHTWTIAADR